MVCGVLFRIGCVFPLLPARVRHYHYLNRILNEMEAFAWGGDHYLASPDVASPWLSSTLPPAFWPMCVGGQVWGRSTKHDPMRCGLAHQLQDEDVLQIVAKTVTQQVCGHEYFHQEHRKRVRRG